MILFDENIAKYWVQKAKSLKIDFISIRDSYPGINDEEVIHLALKNNALIVTEDKDFGKLVHSYGHKNISVLLIRFNKPDYIQIEEVLFSIIRKYSSEDDPRFIVITDKKLRIRRL